MRVGHESSSGAPAVRRRSSRPGRRARVRRRPPDRSRPPGRGPAVRSRTTASALLATEPSNGPCLPLGGEAPAGDGAAAASGQMSQRGTRARHRCAEVEQRLVPGVAPGRRVAARRGLRRPPQHATGGDVRRRHSAPEGEAGAWRPGGVRPDPGQRLQCLHIPGEASERDHRPRGPLQLHRTAVVAEARPFTDHVRRGRSGSASGRRPAREARRCTSAAPAPPASAAASPPRTRMAYGSCVCRQGRSRPQRSYQARSAAFSVSSPSARHRPRLVPWCRSHARSFGCKPSRCGVLSRAHRTSTMNAPCVLASLGFRAPEHHGTSGTVH